MNSESKQRIGFDIDGTLTDFTGFILNNSKSYMRRKYGYEVIDETGYDVDEIYLSDKCFSGLNQAEADKRRCDIVRKYWNRYFWKYCLLYRMRKGAGAAIRAIQDFYEVVIITSRNRSCEKNISGKIVRVMTRLQLLLNGIMPKHLLFAPDDNEKCRMIKQLHLTFMVDDKPDVLQKIKGDTEVICISAPYNEICGSKGIKRIEKFSDILDMVMRRRNHERG